MIPNLYTEYVTSCAFQADALATRLTYLRYSYIRSVSPRRLTLPSQSGRHGSWSAHKKTTYCSLSRWFCRFGATILL